MPFHGSTPRLVLAASLAAGVLACSHEHGPLSDTPDPTSLGRAGSVPPGRVSTAYGLSLPSGVPGVPLPGTVQGETSPLTTQAHSADSLLGRPVDQEVGNDTAPQTGNAMVTWTSGPNLPVEPWNMALQPPPGEGEGHGGGHSHEPSPREPGGR
jgi:hypothetical protein